MRPSTFLLPCVLCVGCFPELEMSHPGTEGADGGEDGSGEEGGDVDRLELELDPAEPYHGSTAGGMETYLRGGPFDTSVEIWFGEEPAEVIAVAETEVRVLVPAYSDEGAVTVRAQTDTHEGEVGPGFRYWLDQSDQIVMTGFMMQWDWVGPGDHYRWIQGALVQTVPGSWSVLDAFGKVGTCGYAPKGTVLVDMPDEARLASGTVKLDLSPSEDVSGLYYYAEDPGTELAGREFSLEVPTGSYPEVVLEDALNMSEGIVLSHPVIDSEYDYIDIGSGPFRWSGGTGEYVLLNIYDYADTSRSVSCIVDRSQGSQQISAQILHAAGFASEEACYWDWGLVCGDEFEVLIRLTDLTLTENILDFNNGVSELWGATGVLGRSYLWEEQ